MDVTAHFWRDDAAQVLDVVGAINQQPAISGGICKPPQGLDGQKPRGGIRGQNRGVRGGHREVRGSEKKKDKETK